MRKSKLILLFVLILFLISACKKDKLTGDAQVLAGTWRWVETPYPGGNPSTSGYTMTLILKGKGNYEIKKNDDRIEGGRIIIQKTESTSSGYCFFIEFKDNDLFTEKQTFPGNCAISSIGQDSIYIYENIDFTDQAYHLYIKNN
jgi:hypothetical protein